MKVGIVPITHFRLNCSLLLCETINRAAVVDPGGDRALAGMLQRTL